ncbi:L-aspartate oxidase [Ectothiorhodospira haloalkaliphila]|uniref:L-aspartate oxidase n=1 Tax=Ectothiorhodospira haloalkaliphila TaxID=421628 RepID=W8KHN9_9GAMM|nr:MULTISPECIES: L-aspartate oxidase [Ectothiorhodospira]AHK78663.1 L-aspartate oxidase [Ectothiorhodospira haloalkaliphila]MCG5493936.1 L-aspartate oxidase [Ectothiorhodospira variabilis]MCG5498150.1 L-aspartate oxidase [Ectothiorhodospira variabilis]MCG5503739.1 L-aspartate oxidase [Ectothiorhodospira variabilis]MCG5506895.1 L-aspartate oxidase [Ectothiorhodospira variabilis]
MQEDTQAPERQSADVLIIGSGAAGLSLALHLASERRVAVLSKGPITEGSTLYAQGGVSAVLDRKDSIDAHVRDTLGAGAGLCDEKAVRHTVENGPQSIQWLLDLGVPFTREPTENGRVQLHLTREGGHSHRRVVHAADATGQAIESTLVEQVRRHDNIQLFEHHIAVDLINSAKLGLPGERCLGAYVLDLDRQQVEIFDASAVVLATGGASKVYLYSSNPDGSTGDGIAMAWRAGCRVANMEFMQFHPTCLFHPKAKSFLISEAVRGEGGRLLLPNGDPFMHDFDPRGELAPRDIVARAIDHEMKRLGADHLFLDISHKPADFIKGHFPTIYKRCLEFGFDITRDPLPVVPAAHYTCGGVVTDLSARTDLDGLYAIGEVAYTGLHGANRMASNSLLECLVFARSAATHILAHTDHVTRDAQIPPWDESRVTDSDEEVVVSHNWDELRRFMWDYVGIVRSSKRLQRALRRIELLQGEIQEYYSNFRVSNDLIELRNLAVVAEIIIRSALSRQESRGLHYTIDYPDTDPALDGIPTLLVPGGTPGRELPHA